MSHDVYVHLGDATHHPMQTVRARSRADLLQYVADAKLERWPIRFQIGHDSATLKEALHALVRRGGGR